MKDGGPVYPIRTDARHVGISARDYFAAAALTGLLSSAEVRDISFEDYAKCAYHHADAMLAERDK